MVGGGTVFFDLGHRFPTAMINDINPDVVNVYAVVRDQVEDIIDELQSRPDYYYYFHHRSEDKTRAAYHAIRDSDPADCVKRAARLLYLNRTSFNGLMRYNGAGRFNADLGSYTDPIVCRPEQLRTCARALRGTRIGPARDANELLRDRRLHYGGRRLLIIDPPYHHPAGKFTGYYGQFTEEDQARLVQIVLATGWPFIYTNRASDFILNLFQDEPDVALESRRLKHSIQPVYTAGLVEQELLAHRLPQAPRN
jgi:DNA adenine methylase